MSNKIKFGIKGCHYAKATIASTGAATYGTPVALPGAVSISMDAQGDQDVFYADNIGYYVTSPNNGYEGDLELALIPDSFYKDILGYFTDVNGVLLEDANVEPAHFALTFQFEGDENAVRHVLYNCVAKRPTLAGSTKEENIDPQTETLSIVATTVYNSVLDKDIVKARCTPAQTAQYNSWNTTIYQTASTA